MDHVALGRFMDIVVRGLALTSLYLDQDCNANVVFSYWESETLSTTEQAERDLTSRYKPLLHYLSGLILTSVALVAAAMAAMKDAWGIPDWQKPLSSFLGWMAATIVFATIIMAVLQWRRCHFTSKLQSTAAPNRLDYFLGFIVTPIPGLIAALQLAVLAIKHAGFFWWAQ